MASKKNFEFEVDVNGDISGLNQAMNSATKVFKSFERSLQNIKKARDLAPQDESLLTRENQLYIDSIKQAQLSLNQLYAMKRKLERDPNFIKGITDEKEQYTSLIKKIKEVRNEIEKLKDEQSNLPTREQDRINRKFETYKKTVEDATKEIAKYKQILENIDKQIELDPTNVDLYAQRQGVLNEMMGAYEGELQSVTIAKEKFESSNNAKFYDDHEKEISEVSLKVKELGIEYQNTGKILQNIPTPNLQAFSVQMEQLSRSAGDIAAKTSRMSNAFKTIIGDGLTAARSYEDDIASIRKVAGDLTDDIVADLKTIAIETGNSFDKVAEYATISAALGLAGDEITEYTKALLDLNAVSGEAFSGEEGAKAVAVFLKQLNLGIGEAENFGSAIATIGDAYADIGDETLNVATQLSAIATLVNTNQYELIGLAGVMADLGLSSDSNANAINRAFMQINNVLADTSAKGQKKLVELANTAGMTSKEFRDAWGKNAVDAFLRFTDGLKSSTFNEINDAIDKSSAKVKEYADVLGWSGEYFVEQWSDNSKLVFDQYVEKLSELDEESEVASSVLKDLGISSVYTAQTLLRLAGSGNEVRNAISLATDAWDKNIALQEKTDIIYSTTTRKLESFYESLRQLKSNLIESVLPYIKDVIDDFTDLAKAFGKAPPIIQKLSLAFLGLGASVSPIARGVSNVAGLMSLLGKSSKKTTEAISSGIVDATGAILTADKATSKFALNLGSLATVGKIGLAVAGVAALGTAIYYAYEKSKDASYYAKKDMQGIAEESQNLRSELVELNKKIANNANEWENSQRPLYTQAKLIDELYNKIKNGYLTDKEAAEAKKELKDRIDELNKSLGENKWNFDETKQAIVDEKGQIVDALIPAYQELAIERKKSYMLEDMQDEYMQALQNEEDYLEKNKQARLDYIKVLTEAREKYGAKEWFTEDFIEFAESYKTLGKEGAKVYEKMTEEQKKAFVMIASAKAVLDGTIESINGVHTENQKLIDFYEKLSNLSGKEAERLMEVWQLLGDTDFGNVDLENVKSRLEEINNILAERRLLNEDEIEAYETAKTLLEEYYEEIEDYQARQKVATKELYDEDEQRRKENIRQLKEEVEELYNHENGEIVRKVIEGTDQYTIYQEQRHKDMWLAYLDEAMHEADAVQEYINSKTYWAHVHLIVDNLDSVGSIGSSVIRSKSSQMMQSGGFGDMFSGVYSAIQTSLGNFRSGGFNSGGIVVNANFNITNGNNINQATVQGWGMSIAEQINEYLGNQF